MFQVDNMCEYLHTKSFDIHRGFVLSLYIYFPMWENTYDVYLFLHLAYFTQCSDLYLHPFDYECWDGIFMV